VSSSASSCCAHGTGTRLSAVRRRGDGGGVVGGVHRGVCTGLVGGVPMVHSSVHCRASLIASCWSHHW
jgi:hypothetical protein